MPASLTFSSSIMASTTVFTTCPFCNFSYLQLGKHLPHCKKRDGKDYTHLLSIKTLQKRAQSSKKTECPKCLKRLDTHFRVSATCKEINSIPFPNNLDMHSGLEQSCTNQSTIEDAILFTPMHLNCANTAPAVSMASTLTTTSNTSSHYPNPLTKAILIIPTTDEGWEQANSYF